jgi:hypothetical protein
MNKLIFLDIDGVLNTPDDWVAAKVLPDHINTTNATTEIINRTKVGVLKYLVEETGAEIVLTSTWRFFGDKTNRMMKLCGWEDFSDIMISQTTRDGAGHRDEEVMQWLRENDQTTDKFVILDDIAPVHWHPSLHKHLVHIDNTIGLRFTDVEKAKEILK